MLLILFVVLCVILVFLLIRQKIKIDKLNQNIFRLEKEIEKNSSEEFTLGLNRISLEAIDPSLLDPLTGLPGVNTFDDRLLQTINQSKRFDKSFAVMLLDINEIRDISQSEGYPIGDKILREVAQRIPKVIRQIDTMTRYAGNKFIFLLPQLSMPETAAYVAQRILDTLTTVIQIDNEEIYISANIGVAIYPTDGETPANLLINLEEALTKSKVLGKGRYQFYRQEMHLLGQRELSLQNFLSSNDVINHLYIDFRPFINVNTNQIACNQALLCLNHPDLGVVPFLDFARIAENCGKINEIGLWFLNQAILQFKELTNHQKDPGLLMLTVTLRQLEHSKFISDIANIIKQLQLDPQKIIFEIADKNLFVNTQSLENAFVLLSKLDVQISLSIFALGHLALQRITKLPVNYLKIDAKLLQEKSNNPENETILHTIISLAKDMNINIIADGIDNEKKRLSKKTRM